MNGFSFYPLLIDGKPEPTFEDYIQKHGDTVTALAKENIEMMSLQVWLSLAARMMQDLAKAELERRGKE